MLQLGISKAMPDWRELPYNAYMQELAAAGYRGISTDANAIGAARDPATRAALEKQLDTERAARDAAGIVALDLTPGLMPSHARADGLAETAMALAARAGAPGLRILGAPYVRAYKPGDEYVAWYDGLKDYQTLLDATLRDFEVFCRAGEAVGVKLYLEIHGGYINSSPATALKVMEPFGAERIGIIHDPENQVLEGSLDYKMGIEMLGDYLAFVHVKNSLWEPVSPPGRSRFRTRRVRLSEGLVDWGQIIQYLVHRDWHGVLADECMIPGHSLDDRLAERDYLKSLIATAETNRGRTLVNQGIWPLEPWGPEPDFLDAVTAIGM